jgi:hypothetical protein
MNYETVQPAPRPIRVVLDEVQSLLFPEDGEQKPISAALVLEMSVLINQMHVTAAVNEGKLRTVLMDNRALSSRHRADAETMARAEKEHQVVQRALTDHKNQVFALMLRMRGLEERLRGLKSASKSEKKKVVSKTEPAETTNH